VDVEVAHVFLFGIAGRRRSQQHQTQRHRAASPNHSSCTRCID
jgi:hypothetical protein